MHGCLTPVGTSEGMSDFTARSGSIEEAFSLDELDAIGNAVGCPRQGEDLAQYGERLHAFLNEQLTRLYVERERVFALISY
jgi:hypothetical protein